MEFNFGSKPFKFAVPPNFVAVNDAPSNYVSSNTSGTSAPALDHLVSNAPLALIIEVWIFFSIHGNSLFEAVNSVIQSQVVVIFLDLQPSRELAEQTQKEIKNLMKYLDEPVIRTMLAAGGIPIKEQLSDLQKGVRLTSSSNSLKEYVLSLFNFHDL